jgi:tripartite-type tricarboxylate transporter receptor subunit TctC
MGGQIPIMFDGMATSLPQIRAGKLRVLAVASGTRSAHLPQVPTMSEQGFPEIVYGGWFGFIVSSGVPDELVTRMNAAMVKAASAPKLMEKMAAAGLEPNVPMTPAQMAQLIKTDFDRNAATVKAFDIKINQ